jgi:hypothetical protein
MHWALWLLLMTTLHLKAQKQPSNSEKASHNASLFTPSRLRTMMLLNHFCNFGDKPSLRCN